jgi:MFS family permease
MWLTTLYQWPPQLHKFKLGIVTGVLAVTWALSGAAVGKLSDKLGVRKPILLGAILAFPAFSAVGARNSAQG